MTNQVIKIRRVAQKRSQRELFGDILEKKTTLRIDAEGEELQRLKEELAKDEQRNEKLAKSLRIALDRLQR